MEAGAFCVLPVGAFAVGAGRFGRDRLGAIGGREIVPPQPGLRVCYRKPYDARHLAEYPLQSVTEMIFYLRVYRMEASGAPLLKNADHLAYQFGLSLRRRGEKRFRTTAGDCTGDKVAECYVDCDGGGVTIENGPEKRGLRVLLQGEGIAFGNDCDTTRGSFVGPGADDKIFDLEPAPFSECAYLEKRMEPSPDRLSIEGRFKSFGQTPDAGRKPELAMSG